MNISKLKGKLAEKDLKYKDVAAKIPMSVSTFYRHMKNGGKAFTVFQARRIGEIVPLTYEEFKEIFFS